MDDDLKRMKANPDNKLVKKSCETCEFNFGNVCAGYGKEPIMEMTRMVCQ